MLLWFAAAAWAQAPTQLPGQTNPAAPGQPPAEKKDQQGAAPKPSTPAAESQQFYEVKVGANRTWIEQPSTAGQPALSFLTPGDNVTADLTILEDQTFGTRRFQFLSILRSNNDPRVDPEQNSLQRGYIKLTTPNWDWSLGDTLVSYSRLTYNQNIKGLSITRKFGNRFRLAGNGGVFTDRWGSIWKDGLLGKPYTRMVAGGRAEFQVSKDKVIGLNFSHGRDMESSIRPDLRQFGLTPLDNNIGSVDARLTFKRVLSVDGELAYSSTNFDTRIYRDFRKDYGGRVDTSLRSGRFSLRTSYVRLMPSFLAVNARQLADLQDAMVRAGVDLSDHLTIEGTYRHTNNNLRGNRPEGTTTFQMPEGRLSLRRLPGFGKTVIDLGYRVRLQDGPTRLADPLKGQLENRRVPTPFAEVQIPLGNTLVSVGWERRYNRNTLLPSENTTANHWSGSLRSNFGLGRWSFAPMARYEMETEEFFRVFGFNTNRSVLASAFVDAPKWLSFEASYRVIGASLFAECVEVQGGAPCVATLPSVPGTTILLPSGFRRPSFHAAIILKIKNSEDRFITFSYDRNTNFFALPGRDFKERVVAVTLVFRLRR